MEMFCHINELRAGGYANLRTLVLSCASVKLWAPSATYMQELRKKDPLLPTPDELLAYVKGRHVQIMAREPWILGQKEREEHHKRKTAWHHAWSWDDSFDGSLRQLYIEDMREGRSTTARIRKVRPEDGWQWAQKQLSSGSIEVSAVLECARKSSQLPAFLEKAGEQATDYEAAQSLLRDARNHGVAFAESGADRNLGTPGDGALLRAFSEPFQATGPPRDRAKPVDRDPAVLVQALEGVFERLANCKGPVTSQEEAFERTMKILSDPPELARLRNWVHTADALAATTPDALLEQMLSADLVERVGPAAVRPLLLDLLMGKTSVEKALTLLSLVILVIHVSEGLPHPEMTAAPIALRLLHGVLQVFGYVPADTKIDRWLLYLAGIKGNWRQVDKMARALKTGRH